MAVVAGLRTPFAKQGRAFGDLSALALGATVVKELVIRAEIDPHEIGAVIYGQAVPSPAAPNIAREIVFQAGLPKRIEAFSVSRACATSFQAAASAAEAILSGQHDVIVAGGADSASDVPIAVGKRLGRALVALQQARTLGEKARIVASLSPRDLVPVPPSLRELSTGLTMGEHAERMAKEWGITRAEQDRFAHRSHERAADAWQRGLFDAEVMRVSPPPYDRPIAKDDLVRADSKLASYARLEPVFDRRDGTITAGSSSALTDGAAALLMMSEARAQALGTKPLGYLRSWAFAALDPNDGLLMGPAYSTPLALDRAGLSLSDIDLVEMHEAFAAQVLCNRRAFASRRFAEEKLGRAEPLGEIADDRLNVHGGSIAIGHPFAATGARMIHTALRELARRGGKYALATACAAGGIGASVVLEAA